MPHLPAHGQPGIGKNLRRHTRHPYADYRGTYHGDSGVLNHHSRQCVVQNARTYVYLRTVCTMAKPKSKIAEMIALTQRQPLLRPADLDRFNIPRSYLYRFVTDGRLIKLQRGLFRPVGGVTTEQQSLIEVSAKAPKAIICLLSALQFHGITTQLPSEVWLAIDVDARAPRIAYPPIRVVRSSGRALAFGIRQHIIDGVKVRIYSPAKTVADCFKFRNKIGLDIAIEALREALRQKKATTDELWEAAKVCRVSNIMMPYMESLT